MRQPPRIKQHAFRAAVVGAAAWLVGCNHPAPMAAQTADTRSVDAAVDAGLPMPPETPALVLEPQPEPASPTEEAGDSAPPSDVSLVGLEELAPTPRPGGHFPTTAMVRPRSQPADGVRERTGDFAVESRCEGQACLDGLRDLRTRRELISVAPTQDEKEILKAEGSVERVVKLASSSDRFVSVYTGYSEYSGGAHANNDLSCATFDRRTGRRLQLKNVVTPKEAQSLMRRAREKLEAFAEEERLPKYQLNQMGFLHDADARRVALCAEATYSMAGTVVVIWLQLEPARER